MEIITVLVDRTERLVDIFDTSTESLIPMDIGATIDQVLSLVSRMLKQRDKVIRIPAQRERLDQR